MAQNYAHKTRENMPIVTKIIGNRYESSINCFCPKPAFRSAARCNHTGGGMVGNDANLEIDRYLARRESDRCEAFDSPTETRCCRSENDEGRLPDRTLT